MFIHSSRGPPIFCILRPFHLLRGFLIALLLIFIIFNAYEGFFVVGVYVYVLHPRENSWISENAIKKYGFQNLELIFLHKGYTIVFSY